MILVAVVSGNLVEKLYKTRDSLEIISDFLQVLYPKAKVVEVNGITGFPKIGSKFDGVRFLGLEGE